MFKDFDNIEKLLLIVLSIILIGLAIFLGVFIYVYIDNNAKNKKQIQEIGIDNYLYSKGFGVLSNEITTLQNDYVDKQTIYDYYIRHGYKLINVSNDTEVYTTLTYSPYMLGKGAVSYPTTYTKDKVYFEFQK